MTMAMNLLNLPICLTTSTKCLSTSHIRHRITLSSEKSPKCAASKQGVLFTQNENRRSANYQPNIWTQEYLHSLKNDHLVVEKVEERAKALEEKVRLMVNRMEMEPRSLLELIDDIQRLGLYHRFEEDIKRALERIFSTQYFKDQTWKSLHDTSLLFRLLRQHGFDVSEDVFERFKDEEGKFKAEISNDVQGLLSLYEASHLTFEGESLWDANAFSTTHLINLMKDGIETEVAVQVKHVLEGLPFHRSFHRLYARRYFDIYTAKESHNPLLLELAKLDFNIDQLSYQKELQEVFRWWMDIGLARKLDFSRDRLVETFFWSVAMLPEPRFTSCRKTLTKVSKLITTLDDIYDVYGTLDELELLTNAIDRWDLMNAINTLPDYMALYFQGLYNTVNEIAYDIFKERGVKCLPYLTKGWSDLCKSYLQEAKWFYNKVIPPMNEFLENGWISSGGGVILIHSYFLVSQDQDITEDALHSLTNYHDLLRSSMTILRLCNDLGTSTDERERGEISTSIVSYLHETGLSEEKARQYYKTLLEKEWQKVNKCRVMDSTFSKSFIEVAINLGRTSQFVYQHGDGYGRQDDISMSRIKLLLVDPVQVN